MRFLVKPIVNDIKEVVRGILIAAEGKEQGNAAKKIIKTIEVFADNAIKNEIITDNHLCSVQTVS